MAYLAEPPTAKQRAAVFGKIKDKDGNKITPAEVNSPRSLHLTADA